MKTLEELGLWKLAWPELQTEEGQSSGATQHAGARAGGSASGSTSAASGSSSHPGPGSEKRPAAFRGGNKAISKASQPPQGHAEQMLNMMGADGTFDWQRMMVQMQMQMQQHPEAASSSRSEEPASQANWKKPHYETFENSILNVVQDGAGGEQDGWENSLEEESRYLGFIRDFNEGGGFGFIECAKAKAKYGMDCWIHRRQMFGFKVGDEVSFMVARNHNGHPQARHVIKACDVARIKAKKKAQEQRAELQLRQKKSACQSYQGVAGGVMDEEAAKRFQASLKRKRG